ncbi:hypothetical protein N8I77_006765 [Diaporthe amygdali]|uniref:Uncharacterized protein n=1 Tax=Phomopsis amygdali TaxID=1214568 RepID=A0AAD9SIF1_PHOAM|nr:hypothetical protein N8I77_006765 [Diaporthe amygdali]
MDQALVKDVDEQPQSSWYRKPDGHHRLANSQGQPQIDSVLTDDDDHVREADGEEPHSAWYRKPRPERLSSIGPDLELAEPAGEKKRKICGVSRPTFIVILFFLIVVVAAAIAGGVAGSQAWRGSTSTSQSAAS